MKNTNSFFLTQISVPSWLKNRYIWATFALVLLATLLILTSQSQNGSSRPILEEPNIVAPEAPLSEEVSTSVFGTAKIDQVEKFVLSPSGKNALVLTSIEEKETTQASALENILHTFVRPVNALSTNGSSKLSIYDKEGNLKKEVEEAGVTEGDFIDDENIFYQLFDIGEESGIYLYDLTNDKKTLMVKTQDIHSFGNVIPLNKNKYFFIQPNTGKVGFGKLGSDKLTILEEKLLDTKSTYAKAGAFYSPSLSPDGKYVAFYDAGATEEMFEEGFNAKLKIYPTNAKSAKDIYITENIIFPPGGFQNHRDDFGWSADSRYLTAGADCSVIDLKTKQVLHRVEGALGFIAKLSPNAKKIAVLSYENGSATLQDLEGNALGVIHSEFIREMEWMTQDLLVLTIAKRLYIFNAADLTLAAATEIEANYSILEIDPSKGKAWILENDYILEINQI